MAANSASVAAPGWLPMRPSCRSSARRTGGRRNIIEGMSTLSPDTRTSLRRILTGRQSEHRIPGVVGGVARGGELLWSDGAGAADLARPEVAPDADSQYLIASITKTFTAVMTMQLRDEGKLSLDDTLERFVPENKHEGVTIRQMLSRVTGMQREPVGDIWETLTYPDRQQLVAGWNEA